MKSSESPERHIGRDVLEADKLIANRTWVLTLFCKETKNQYMISESFTIEDTKSPGRVATWLRTGLDKLIAAAKFI